LIMNGIGLHTFVNIFYDHWISAFLICVTITTIGVIFALRWYVRRRLHALMENGFSEDHELDLLPSPGPREQESLELIARFREEVWGIPEGELQLALDPLTQRAVAIIRAIGGVYNPDAKQPEYEASLTDTMELVKRVSTRLSRLASTVPFRYLGDRKLSDFQRYYQVYLKINENPVLKILKKNPSLYKAARLVWNVKNMGNPLYWAGRELSREGYFFILRWFYLTFTSEIGKEAIRLYSGKRFQQEADRDAALVCYRLYHTMRKWGGPSTAEWAAFVTFVANHATLDADSKLHVLARCSEDRLPKDLDQQKIATKSGIKWYKEGLKKMLDADSGPSPAKLKLVEKESEEQDAAG
jgi:hypothetical protein